MLRGAGRAPAAAVFRNAGASRWRACRALAVLVQGVDRHSIDWPVCRDDFRARRSFASIVAVHRRAIAPRRSGRAKRMAGRRPGRPSGKEHAGKRGVRARRRRRRGWAAGLSRPSAVARPPPRTARPRCRARRAGRGGRGPPAGWCRSPRARASGRSRPSSRPVPRTAKLAAGTGAGARRPACGKPTSPAAASTTPAHITAAARQTISEDSSIGSAQKIWGARHASDNSVAFAAPAGWRRRQS